MGSEILGVKSGRSLDAESRGWRIKKTPVKCWKTFRAQTSQIFRAFSLGTNLLNAANFHVCGSTVRLKVPIFSYPIIFLSYTLLYISIFVWLYLSSRNPFLSSMFQLLSIFSKIRGNWQFLGIMSGFDILSSGIISGGGFFGVMTDNPFPLPLFIACFIVLYF